MNPARHWLRLCAALAALSLLAGALPAAWLDWQPGLVATQPWRVVTAAFVHWTPLHLAANLAGCAVLGLLGWRARFGLRETAASLLALPLTQLALLLRPALLHYGGLSGVLHSLAAVAALSLMRRPGRDRWVGAGIGLGLAAKIALEAPLGPVLQATAGFDFPVAPFAHLSGALAGALAWGLTMQAMNRLMRSPHGT